MSSQAWPRALMMTGGGGLALLVGLALLSAAAGTLDFSFIQTAQPDLGLSSTFPVFAAVIIGGASLAGGKGSLMGTLIGVIMLRTLDNGLILLNVSSYYQDVARGVVLLLTVGIDQLRLRLEKRAAARNAT